MSKPLIKPVTDNKDKENTYSIYIDMYNSSMENGYYGEAELIVYAFIEDRLLSFLSHLNVTESDRVSLKKDAYEFYKGKKLKLYDLSTKLDVLNNLLSVCKNNRLDNAYINYIKDCIGSSIEYDELENLIKDLRQWSKYRNEIVHGLFNKNIEALRSNYRNHVEKGYKIGRRIDKYVKRIK